MEYGKKMIKKIQVIFCMVLVAVMVVACSGVKQSGVATESEQQGTEVSEDAIHPEGEASEKIAQSDGKTSEDATQSDGKTSEDTTQSDGKTSEDATQSDGKTSEDMPLDENTTLTIYALNGGAADTFILISDSHVAVIDTGLNKNGEELVAFLQEKGVTKIDELIITHYDKDHVGGADHVINNFEIGTVYTTYQSKESNQITSYMEALSSKGLEETVVSQELSYEADGISFTIYPPQSRFYEESMSNNSSLAIMVELGDNSMLFAGDAEEARIQELLEVEDLDCTILKVPHHGRYKTNFNEFIEHVSPEYAIITSSDSEPEDQEVLDILSGAGAETFLTKEGDITITMTATDVLVTQ